VLVRKYQNIVLFSENSIGINAKVLSEGEEISRRGSKEGTPFNGDTILKMVNMIDPHDFISWYNRGVGKVVRLGRRTMPNS